jgi:signal transduction histidine kinase
VSDLTVISLSLAELDGVLQRDSQLSVHFVTVLIRSLARRVERAAELQVEVEQLNQKLSGERDQLASTLRQLERTQMRLVESEKMATLGQMSAGIAHELNNPVTAIHRTASHLREDIDLLIGQLPDAENVREEIERLFNAAPISTRDERAARKAIAEQIRDDALADRLVRAGLTRIEDVRGRFGTLDTNTIEAAMPNLETHARLAKSLRNLVTCAARITDLVGSLRSYAKPGMEYETDVDLHACIEDTIRLFGHASREVQIERDYGELPLVACRVGELNQVWTNLISNALNAMHHAGTLRVSTRVAGGDHVVVDITDSGPGVAPSNIDRIFDMNFTTRSGPAHFGLGLGLPISKSIVERHGGTLTVTSEPGRTTFTTLLPIERPALLDEESSP